MNVRPHHVHITSPAGGRPALPADAPTVLATVSADRRLRGPYTAAGEVARAIAADAVERVPALAARHEVELLAVAPELAGTVVGSTGTLTSALPGTLTPSLPGTLMSSLPEGHTRTSPLARTRPIAHGLVELVNGYVASLDGPRALAVEGVEHADGTDAEWLAILLRRTDPARLRIVVIGSVDVARAELRDAVDRHAAPEPFVALPPAAPPANDSDHERARRFVDSDGTDDAPELVASYWWLSERERAALHDARADELEALDQPSWRLGAIPYHRQHGADPTGAGVAALLHAVGHGVRTGFHESVVELGGRCLALLDRDERPDDCSLVVARMATAMTALGRPDEAAGLYDELCAASTLPSVHLGAAYGRAMLLTHVSEDRRTDHRQATACLNIAIALSQQLPETERRALDPAIEHGLALVELHLGDAEQALRLLTAALDRADADADAGLDGGRRSALRHDRARLLDRLGRTDDALVEYGRVIDADPNRAGLRVERAAVLRRLGRPAEAMVEYQAAVRLGPPHPEPHLALAGLAIELGNFDAARTELAYVLELEPDVVDAYVARADIAYRLRDIGRAAAEVRAGLEAAPAHPQLLCLAGVLALETGRTEEARAAFDAALEVDDSLVEAWAKRAILAFRAGDVDAAVGDLSAALAIEDSAALGPVRAQPAAGVSPFTQDASM